MVSEKGASAMTWRRQTQRNQVATGAPSRVSKRGRTAASHTAPTGGSSRRRGTSNKQEEDTDEEEEQEGEEDNDDDNDGASSEEENHQSDTKAAMGDVDDVPNHDGLGRIMRDYTIGDFKLSMWIPSDLAGRVIGKKGIVITNMQRETKAKLINALPPVGDALWIAVVIIGDMHSIMAAYKAISDLVQDEVDEVVLEFTINYRRQFFLYGMKKFGILKRISASSNVRIFFPEFNPKEQAFSQAKPVTLEGDCADVCKAVKMFEVEALLYREQQSKKYSEGALSKAEQAAAKAPAVSDKQVEPVVTAVNNDASVAGGVDTAQETAVAMAPDAIETATTTVAAVADTSSSKRQKFEKLVDIPASLVGLLLSKKGRKPSSSTMNSIQKYTHTFISKTPAASKKGTGGISSTAATAGSAAVVTEATAATASTSTASAAGGGSRRRRAAGAEEEEDDDEDHDDESGFDDAKEGGDSDSDSDEDNGDEEEEEEEEDSDAFESAGEGSNPDAAVATDIAMTTAVAAADSSEVTAAASAVKSDALEPDVTFRVVSTAEESVDMVIRALQRIIKGEPIKSVLEELRIEGKNFARVYAQKMSSQLCSEGTTVGAGKFALQERKRSSRGGVNSSSSKRGSGRSSEKFKRDAAAVDVAVGVKPKRSAAAATRGEGNTTAASTTGATTIAATAVATAAGVVATDQSSGRPARASGGRSSNGATRGGRGRSGPPATPSNAPVATASTAATSAFKKR